MTTTANRLDLRITTRDKAVVTRAAELRGLPVSVFVRDAVLREAEKVMEAESTVILSGTESKRFLAALDKPFQPNPKLMRALTRLSSRP